VRRQMKIGYDNIDYLGIDKRDRLFSRRSLEDLIIRDECPIETTPHCLVIINDEYDAFDLRLLYHDANSFPTLKAK
jgi:hypothetical protein